MSSDLVLKTEGLTKHYGGVHALTDANFELRKGEHVAIMGDNGAGKSTFVRQLTGVEQPTRGKIILYGKDVSFKGPLEAREAGIETVFQSLALADDLDVPSNVFLGREKYLIKLGPFSILDRKAMRADTVRALERTAVKIPNLGNRIRNMSGGQRQCVAIARAVHFGARVLILDEPTSALGVHQAGMVLRIVAQARDQGIGIVFITHNIHHAFPIADTFTLLNRGRSLGCFAKGEVTEGRILEMMSGGRDLDRIASEVGRRGAAS